jgi:hypothetical protein
LAAGALHFCGGRMTDGEKRALMDAMAASNKLVMGIVCPPGTLALLMATWVVGIPGLIWLFWITH